MRARASIVAHHALGQPLLQRSKAFVVAADQAADRDVRGRRHHLGDLRLADPRLAQAGGARRGHAGDGQRPAGLAQLAGVARGQPQQRLAGVGRELDPAGRRQVAQAALHHVEHRLAVQRGQRHRLERARQLGRAELQPAQVGGGGGQQPAPARARGGQQLRRPVAALAGERPAAVEHQGHARRRLPVHGLDPHAGGDATGGGAGRGQRLVRQRPGQRGHHGAAPGAGVTDDADHPLAGRRQQIQQAADLPLAVQHRAGRWIDGQEVAARQVGRWRRRHGGGGRDRSSDRRQWGRHRGRGRRDAHHRGRGGLGGRTGDQGPHRLQVPRAPGSRPGTGCARLAWARPLGHAGGARQRAQHHRPQPRRLLPAEAQQLHRAAARAQQRHQQVQRRRLARAQAGGDLVAGTGEVLHREPALRTHLMQHRFQPGRGHTALGQQPRGGAPGPQQAQQNIG